MVDNPKYIYIKGHSSLNKDATTVKKKPGVGYVYLAPPGVTCYAGGMRHIKDPETQGVRVLGIDQVLLLWTQIPEIERMNTKNRREFFRILRYLSIDVSGGVPVGQPCIDEEGENQIFTFTGGAGPSGHLGVYDLDLLSSNPGYLSSSWFIDENVVPPNLTLSHIVELVRRKYPSQSLIFLISACRNIVDARGVVSSQGVDEVWALASEFKGRVKVDDGSPGTGKSFLARMRKRFPIFMREYDEIASTRVFGDLCEVAVPMDEGGGIAPLPQPPISPERAANIFGQPAAEGDTAPIDRVDRMVDENWETLHGNLDPTYMDWKAGKSNRKRSRHNGKSKRNRRHVDKSKRKHSRHSGKSKKKTKKKVKKVKSRGKHPRR
jgi:hypothetical protein